MNKIIIASVITMFMLSGCANLNAQNEEKLSIVTARCPVLVQYSKAELKQAAKEFGELPTQSQLVKMTIDYGKLRDACRAIERQLRKNQ